MKHTLLNLSLTVLLLTGSCIYVHAETFISDGIKYEMTGEELSVISNSYSGIVVIPSSADYNGTTYPVTSIGNNAFNGCSNLTSVTIPNSVTTIGYYAFNGCSNLTSVTIPNSVTTIGSYAFTDCIDLRSITIGNSVTHIGHDAFHNTRLTSIYIPSSVTSIERNYLGITPELSTIVVEEGNTTYDSRNNCNAIIETATNTLVKGSNHTNIPNSVTSIGVGAFGDCTGLTSVTIPNSVTSIGSGAFCGCTGLTSVTIPNSVTSIDNRAFEGCTGLASIIIPNSVTYIGSAAFYDCAGLTYISIPNSITSFDAGVFAGCTGLSCIDVYWDNPELVHLSGLPVSTNTTIYVPEGSLEKYQVSDWWSQFRLIERIIRTITYLVDGNEYCSETIRYDTTITPLAEPTKEGYTFSGWSDIPTTMPDSDITVTGTFAINKYKITYIVNDNIWAEDSIAYGSAITPAAEPTQEGYTFSGWSEIPTTMGTEDITVTGTFTKNFTIGDIDNDGELNVGDLSRLVKMILTDYTEPGGTFNAADIDGDGELNVGDYSRLVQMILNAPVAGSKAFQGAALSKGYRSAAVSLTADDIAIGAGQTKLLAVQLSNYDEEFNAVQFDIQLPKGLEIDGEATETAARTNGFGIATNGSRVIVSNTRDQAISGSEGDILYLAIKAVTDIQLGSYEVEFDNILLSTTESEVVKVNSFYSTIMAEDLTGVSSATSDINSQSSNIFDLQGRKVTGKPQKGIYVIDGKKVNVK